MHRHSAVGLVHIIILGRTSVERLAVEWTPTSGREDVNNCSTGRVRIQLVTGPGCATAWHQATQRCCRVLFEVLRDLVMGIDCGAGHVVSSHAMPVGLNAKKGATEAPQRQLQGLHG